MNIKSKMLIILTSIVMLICMVFLVTLNVAVKFYIDSEANVAIKSELAISQNPEVDKTGNDAVEEKSIFIVQSFGIRENFDLIGDSNFLSSDDYSVRQHIMDNTEFIDKTGIFTTNIDGQQYYLSKRTYKDDGVVNWIFYVNTSSVYHVVGILNMAFIIILVISTAVTSFAGLKFGTIIESSELKLKKFFANASHELKTPLMSIQGYAQGLQKGVIKDQQKATQIIIDQSEKMSVLVQEMLYLSKIESGEYVPKKQPVDINELVADCMSATRVLAEKKGITMEMGGTDEEITVMGDEAQFEKAFMNVISNAIKYATTKIIVVTEKHSHYVKIVVQDDGAGIHKSDLPHIFERFYTGEKGNTGIGLSLAKEIITLHRGTIEASNGDVGARFTITLRISSF